MIYLWLRAVFHTNLWLGRGPHWSTFMCVLQALICQDHLLEGPLKGRCSPLPPRLHWNRCADYPSRISLFFTSNQQLALQLMAKYWLNGVIGVCARWLVPPSTEGLKWVWHTDHTGLLWVDLVVGRFLDRFSATIGRYYPTDVFFAMVIKLLKLSQDATPLLIFKSEIKLLP